MIQKGARQRSTQAHWRLLQFLEDLGFDRDIHLPGLGAKRRSNLVEDIVGSCASIGREADMNFQFSNASSTKIERLVEVCGTTLMPNWISAPDLKPTTPIPH